MALLHRVSNRMLDDGAGPRAGWVVGYILGGLIVSSVLGITGLLAGAARPSQAHAVAVTALSAAHAGTPSALMVLNRAIVYTRSAARWRASVAVPSAAHHPSPAAARPAPPSPMAVALAGTQLGPVWGDYAHAATLTGVPLALLVAQGYWESVWNPAQTTVNAPGNVDRGIAQINTLYNPQVSNAEAYNPAWAIVWEGRTLAINYAAGGSSWANALSLYKGGRVESLLTARERAGVLVYVNRVLATEAAIQARLHNPPALAAYVRAIQ